MFWRLELATLWRLNQVAKNACLAEIGTVFKSFSVFPRTFVIVHLLSKLSPSQTLRESIFKSHWCFISCPNHQEKVWVLISQSHFTYFVDISFTVWIDFVFETFLSLCDGYGLLCLLLFSSIFMLSGHNVFFIVLIFAWCWVWKSFLKWVWCLFDLLISLAWILMLDFGIGYWVFMIT